MIGYLKGQLLHHQPPFLLVEVQGIGYEVEVPMPTFYALAPAVATTEPLMVALYIHFVVRAEAQLLYGFIDLTQRDLFRHLLRTNGVGPRLALAILSALTNEQLTACIQQEDLATMTRIPGVGKKTAERIIIDLRDRLTTLSATTPTTPPAAGAVADAISALVALGYRVNDATRAVEQVRGRGASVPPETLIKDALQALTRRAP